jgi:hypothetical protein
MRLLPMNSDMAPRLIRPGHLLLLFRNRILRNPRS